VESISRPSLPALSTRLPLPRHAEHRRAATRRRQIAAAVRAAAAEFNSANKRVERFLGLRAPKPQTAPSPKRLQAPNGSKPQTAPRAHPPRAWGAGATLAGPRPPNGAKGAPAARVTRGALRRQDAGGAGRGAWRDRRGAPALAPGGRDKARPFSTGGGTRRVQSVRERWEGGVWGGVPRPSPPGKLRRKNCSSALRGGGAPARR